MERICNQDEDDAKLAKEILSWISYALSPLTVKEIKHAVAVEPGEKELDEEALHEEELLISVCWNSNHRPGKQYNPIGPLHCSGVL
jgi:hypothetical protein